MTRWLANPTTSADAEPGVTHRSSEQSAGQRAAAPVPVAAGGDSGTRTDGGGGVRPRARHGRRPGADDPHGARPRAAPGRGGGQQNVADARYWREERVRRGDTIGELLARAGVDDADLRALVRTDPAARLLYQLKPGQAVRVATDADGALVELRFSPAASQMLTIRRDRDGLHATRGDADVETRVALKSGVVVLPSLFAAADEVGLPDASRSRSPTRSPATSISIATCGAATGSRSSTRCSTTRAARCGRAACSRPSS